MGLISANVGTLLIPIPMAATVNGRAPAPLRKFLRLNCAAGLWSALALWSFIEFHLSNRFANFSASFGQESSIASLLNLKGPERVVQVNSRLNADSPVEIAPYFIFNGFPI